MWGNKELYQLWLRLIYSLKTFCDALKHKTKLLFPTVASFTQERALIV